MSIYSLEPLTKEGGKRIVLETLAVIVGYLLTFSIAIGPGLQLVAPEVFVQAGIDYSRTDLPETAMEGVHLLSSMLVVGGFVYWRIYFTELGARFQRAMLSDYTPDE